MAQNEQHMLCNEEFNWVVSKFKKKIAIITNKALITNNYQSQIKL